MHLDVKYRYVTELAVDAPISFVLQYKMEHLPIKGAFKITFRRFCDSRGYFNELFNAQKYGECVKDKSWQQVSFSNSSNNILRGLHCSPYGKFITCTRGSFYDIIADFRPESPTFGKWCKVLLTDTNCTHANLSPPTLSVILAAHAPRKATAARRHVLNRTCHPHLSKTLRLHPLAPLQTEYVSLAVV